MREGPNLSKYKYTAPAQETWVQLIEGGERRLSRRRGLVSFSRVHEVFIDLASRRARHETIGERHILGDVCGVQLATMFAPARAPRDERAAVAEPCTHAPHASALGAWDGSEVRASC